MIGCSRVVKLGAKGAVMLATQNAGPAERPQWVDSGRWL
jgi:hypothetical protein